MSNEIRFCQHSMLLGIVTSIAFITIPGSSSELRRPSEWHLERLISTAEPDTSQTPSVSFQTVAKGARSGVRDALQTLARTQSEWSALWQRHVSNEAAPSKLPVIDFSKEMVLAVFLGEKPTGGYGIEITRVVKTDRSLAVSYREQGPPSGAITTQALTQPFHIVRIPNRNAEAVSFRRVP